MKLAHVFFKSLGIVLSRGIYSLYSINRL